MRLCGKGLHDLDDPAVVYIVPNNGRRQCGPCQRARARRWWAANREHRRTTRRARYANTLEHSRAATRARRTAHPEYYCTDARTQKQRRRARIAHVLATLTAAEWEAILEAAGHTCIYCGCQEQITQDHLMPLARGGEHTAENVVPACLPCNQSKGVKVAAEFLAEAS